MIKAVPVEVSLLEAESPLELFLSLNDFPRMIRKTEMIITTPLIIKEDISSDDILFSLSLKVSAFNHLIKHQTY